MPATINVDSHEERTAIWSWRTEHRSLVLWIEAQVEFGLTADGLYDTLTAMGRLTSEQTIELHARIDGDRHSVARSWDCTQVQNGVYGNEFSNNTYKIVTVKHGRHVGKRVIKLHTGTNRFRDGFQAIAFLNTNHTFSVWSSFQDRFTAVHRREVTAICSGEYGDPDVVVCSICNNAALEQNSDYLCDDHRLEVRIVLPRPRRAVSTLSEPDPELVRLLQEEEEIERTVRSVAQSRRAVQDQSSDHPLLSQLGTGLVR